MLEEFELVGHCLDHVGLEWVQHALVVDHAKGAVGQVAIVPAELDLLDGRQGRIAA